jgi:hypothetical protein
LLEAEDGEEEEEEEEHYCREYNIFWLTFVIVHLVEHVANWPSAILLSKRPVTADWPRIQAILCVIMKRRRGAAKIRLECARAISYKGTATSTSSLLSVVWP